jgi:hypothetical protein
LCPLNFRTRSYKLLFTEVPRWCFLGRSPHTEFRIGFPAKFKRAGPAAVLALSPAHVRPSTSRRTPRVVLYTRPRHPVIRKERANVALEAVVRHRPQAPRLVEATDRQVDFLRAEVLERERRAALAAKPALCWRSGNRLAQLTPTAQTPQARRSKRRRGCRTPSGTCGSGSSTPRRSPPAPRSGPSRTGSRRAVRVWCRPMPSRAARGTVLV